MQTLNTLGVAIVSYLLGVTTGYYGCGIVSKKNMIDGIDSRNFVIAVVSIGWIASVLVEVVNPAFKTNVLLHGLMGAIVGYFFKKKEE